MPLMTWEVPASYPADFAKLLPKCNKLLRQYFWNRNITDPVFIDNLFSDTIPHTTDPMIMKDMRKGVARIWEAIDKKELIVIFGDYDADGVTSTTVMYEGLLGLGANVEWHAPDREEGYGATPAGLRILVAEHPTIKVLLTVDNGIAGEETAALAASLDITMIVTDHHNVNLTVFPKSAYAVINPQQLDCPYPENGLAGVGVAWKFLHGMILYATETKRKLPKGVKKDYADEWIDLVGIGTLCDVMSMLSIENRNIVKRAIERIRTNPRVGIKALCESDEWGNYKIAWQELSAGDIGFKIGPCLNASGRMKHPKHAIHLLMAKKEADAHEFAVNLIQLNTARKGIQQQFTADLKAKLEEEDTSPASMPVICEYIKACPPGIVGLLAGDMARVFARPAMILTEKPNVDKDGNRLLGASCRSVDGFDITLALTKCAKYLHGYGGHPMAAGFTIPEVNLKPFIEMMYGVAKQDDDGSRSEPTMVADVEIPLSAVDWNVYDILKSLEPYGSSFPPIRLMTRNLRVLDYNSLGKTKTHLKLEVTDGKGNIFEVLGWGFGEWVNDMPECIDIIYHIESSTFAGQTKLVLQLDALKPTNAGSVLVQGSAQPLKTVTQEVRRVTQELPVISVTKAKELLGSGLHKQARRL